MKTISAAMKLIDVKTENLRKAFEELESQSCSLSSFTLTWSQIHSHFSTLQSSLHHKFQFLQTLDPQPPPSTNSVVRRPELTSLCQNMDGLGLRNYVIDRPSERDFIRKDLIHAFGSVPDAGALVLDAMEDFSSNNSLELRKACVMLLEVLVEVKGIEIKSEVKERAMKLAVDCKEKIGKVDCSSKKTKNTFMVLGFLLLVAVYGLGNGFSVDELIDCVVLVANNKIAHRLCRLLNFGDQISGLIQKLIRSGRQILAIKFIFEFEMMDKFPPVPLLKAYAEEFKFLFHEIPKSGNQNGQDMREGTPKELGILKLVIKYIENCKLASEFPEVMVLLQQIQKLEAERLTRKRAAPASAFKPEKQSKLQKESPINKFQTTEPAKTTTVPNTANSTIPQNGAASLPVPTYHQQPPPQTSAGQLPDPRIAAAVSYGMLGPNPDIAPYAGSSSGLYEFSRAPTSLSNNQPSFYPSGSHIEAPVMAGSTHTGYSSGLYQRPGASMDFDRNMLATRSSVYSSESQMPAGYFDGKTSYGGYNLPPEYHSSYYQR